MNPVDKSVSIEEVEDMGYLLGLISTAVDCPILDPPTGNDQGLSAEAHSLDAVVRL